MALEAAAELVGAKPKAVPGRTSALRGAEKRLYVRFKGHRRIFCPPIIRIIHGILAQAIVGRSGMLGWFAEWDGTIGIVSRVFAEAQEKTGRCPSVLDRLQLLWQWKIDERAPGCFERMPFGSFKWVNRTRFLRFQGSKHMEDNHRAC